MIIIYGVRPYGRVLECEGECVATSFVHLYFVPLLPVGSLWMTDAEKPSGLRLNPHLLSILTAYLRSWVPLLGAFWLTQREFVLGGALLGAFLLSWTWRYMPRGQRARQRFIAEATGLKCNPDILPRKSAQALQQRALRQWRACFGSDPVERMLPAPEAFEKEALRYAVLRLFARAERSRDAKQTAEAVFKRNEGQALRAKRRTVVDGSLDAFDQVDPDWAGPVMVAWYKPEQWGLLRELAVDADNLPLTYGGWLERVNEITSQLQARGRKLERVDVDVDEMIRLASQANLEVARQLRTRYVLERAALNNKDRVEQAA